MAATLAVSPSAISSAEPQQLLTFADHSRELAGPLKGAALTLDETLLRFRAANPAVSSGNPSVDLLTFLIEWFHLDDWVRNVALKYLKADGTFAIPLGDGITLSVPVALVAQLVTSASHLSLGQLGTLGQSLIGGGNWVWDHTSGARHLLGNIWHTVDPLIQLVRDGQQATTQAIHLPTLDLLGSLSGPVSGSLSGVTGATGLATGIVGGIGDCASVVLEGNPRDQWHERGTAYAADVDQCLFDVSALTASRWPSPWTLGATALTGALWGDLELIHNRGALLTRAAGALKTVGETMGGLGSAGLGAIGHSLGGLPANLLMPIMKPVGSVVPQPVKATVEHVVDSTIDEARKGAKAVGHGLSTAYHALNPFD